MHPNKEILIKFASEQLPKEEIDRVSKHLNECEFCSEFVENTRIYAQGLDYADSIIRSDRVGDEVARLMKEDSIGQVYSLRPLSRRSEPSSLKLAADSGNLMPPDEGHGATYYCEEPEIVLRLTPATELQSGYLQILCEKQELGSNVLICAPELDQQFLTDTSGRAHIPLKASDLSEDTKWEVKLPDAVFSLKPMLPDSSKASSQDSHQIENEQGDRLEITLSTRDDITQVTIKVLALKGRNLPEQLRVGISRPDGVELLRAAADEDISFVLIDSNDEIRITIFEL